MSSLGEDHGWHQIAVWLMDYIQPIFKIFKLIQIFIGVLIMITQNGNKNYTNNYCKNNKKLKFIK